MSTKVNEGITSEGGVSRWQSAVLSESATVKEAVHNLAETGLQVVLTIGPDGALSGTLTDGDIRRGLIRGLTLESPIETIVFRNPIVVPPNMGADLLLHLMQANKVHQLPVIDEHRTVVGLHLWHDLVSPGKPPNVMVIMAGGEGTRLRPHTETCPKPMLPVGGKPMLEHIIERARSQGFERFVIAIHFLGHMIEEHFGDGSELGVCIDYLREEAPLGTAGAIGLLDPEPDCPFLVSNGDVLTDIHYGELLDFHLRHGAAATMAVRLHEWQHPFGVVHTDGLDIVGVEEKPVSRSHINAGIYVLDPGALSLLDAGESCDMPMLFARLQDRGDRTIAYPMHEPWLDVGRAADLSRAQILRGDGE